MDQEIRQDAGTCPSGPPPPAEASITTSPDCNKGETEVCQTEQTSQNMSSESADGTTKLSPDSPEVSAGSQQHESAESVPLDKESSPLEQHSTEQAPSSAEQESETTAPHMQADLSEKTTEPQSQDAEQKAVSAPTLEGETSTDKVDKLPAMPSQTNTGSSEEEALVSPNQNTSKVSTPISGSVSGQDSGVSPDDSSSSSDTQKSLEEVSIASEREPKPHEDTKLEAASAPLPDSAPVSQPQSLSHSQTIMSSDTNTSISETQVTVSDLESPPAADTTTPAEAAAAAAATSSDQESVYYIKWIMFGQNNVPIITQNENGPCPLLAIMNVLLLKEKVKLAPMLEMITSEQLMTYLGECIFENMPQNLTETTQANYEQNMQDAMGVMYKLQTGLDVNVKFTGVGDFEYTPELIIFDLLEISLYHGWLVDPQDPETVSAVNQCSYNQLVEKIISLKHSEQEENVTQALIAEQFLDRTASQLTYHGLCELSSVVKEKELCVFFRNNHFNTLYKHNNELFLLVTDQGFLTESNVVWETLSNVDGDCHFTDATFRTYTKPAPSTEPIPDPTVPVGSPEQIDHDYQVALFLQKEATSLQNPAWAGGYQQESAAFTQADHELAMRLQEEENRRALAEQQRAAAQPAAQPQQQGRYQGHGPPAEASRRRGERVERREKEEKSCSIL